MVCKHFSSIPKLSMLWVDGFDKNICCHLVISMHVISCMSFHVVPCHTMCHTMSNHVKSYNTMCHTMSNHVAPCYIMCHTMCHTMSNHVAPCHTMCHVMSSMLYLLILYCWCANFHGSYKNYLCSINQSFLNIF